MSKLDEIKEEIGWLKIWLGLSVAALFSMIGWLALNYKKADDLEIYFASVGIVIAALTVFFVNGFAMKKIKSLRDL